MEVRMSAISKLKPLNHSASFSTVRALTGSALTLWFLMVLILSSRGAFLRPAGSLPIPILLPIVIPIGLFLIAFSTSHQFKTWILSLDLHLITGVQAWRFGGFAFLILDTLNRLPGYFAWPAGVGDMAVAAAAPFIVASLVRNPKFIASKSFVAWNVLGIVDLVIAVTLGGLGPLLFHDHGTATALMARLPMSLIPTFFVPLFILLHLTALFQRRASA
jgi:hypothetical protein